MKVFRYMSEAERSALLKGDVIENNINHHLIRGKASTAVGFSFGLGGFKSAYSASRRLKGIVTMEYLLVGDIEKDMRPCRGWYTDYDNAKKVSRFFEERCTKKYSLGDFSYYRFFKVTGIDENTLKAILNREAPATSRFVLEFGNRIALADRKSLEEQYMIRSSNK